MLNNCDTQLPYFTIIVLVNRCISSSVKPQFTFRYTIMHGCVNALPLCNCSYVHTAFTVPM